MNNLNIIKVGFCVAYDWDLLKKSLPRVYDYADSICLSIDKNRRSWSGNKYNFDETAFQQFLIEIDKTKKIKIYEDDFSLLNLSPIENDNRQRMLMAEFMGKGGWHIHVDSDEYFLDFKGFRSYLLSLNANPTGNEKPINICCNWISLIKKLASGYLYVNNPIGNLETMPFATNCPVYTNARRNGHFNHISPFFVLHETWARNEEELWQKLNSWGHNDDFINKKSYFNLWKVLDEFNYIYIKNIHPLKPDAWQKLAYVKGVEIEDVIKNIINEKPLNISPSYLFWKNARNWQRIKALLNKLSS